MLTQLTCVRDPRNRKLYGVVVTLDEHICASTDAYITAATATAFGSDVSSAFSTMRYSAAQFRSYWRTCSEENGKLRMQTTKRCDSSPRRSAQHGQFLQTCRREARPFCHFRSARGVTTTTSTHWIRNDEDDKNDVAAVLCAVAHQTHRPTPQT